MAASEVSNLVIYKGSDFEVTFDLFEPDNSEAILSGLTTTYARIYKYPGSSTYEEFSKFITPQTGTINISLTPDQTSKLKAGRNYFEVFLKIYDKIIPTITGTAIVYEGISE